MKKMFLVALFTLFVISCGEGENKDAEDGSVVSSGDTGVSENTQSIKDLFAGVKFVRIPVGSFTMGSPSLEKDRDKDENQVQVEISRSFEIMATEVTQAQYVRVMGKNPSYFKGERYCSNYDSAKDMCPDHPVERVSWNDVQDFIKRLNESKGLKGCKGRPSDPRGCYRLPTEAEWEYSARAGTTTAYFFGYVSQIGNYAVYSGNSGGQTRRVGSKSPNRWVLYDMSGNVWEWIQDTYQASLLGGKDPLVTTGSGRNLRGGSYNDYPRNLRSADRFGNHLGNRYDLIGFRLVRTL